jgi:hypothetical protein
MTMNTSETGMLEVGHDLRTLQDDEMDLVSGGIKEVTGPVAAYRSLLETMADDDCGV